MPSVKLALDHVNEHSGVLRNYRLHMWWNDTMVSSSCTLYCVPPRDACTAVGKTVAADFVPESPFSVLPTKLHCKINSISRIAPRFPVKSAKMLKENSFQCNAAVGVKAFFDMMHSGPHKLMLFGAACTHVTDPIAKASKHWHLTQVRAQTVPWQL